MPQKRNPYPFMIVRGKASRMLALASEIFTTLEGPTLGPANPFYLFEDTDTVLKEFEGIFVIATGFLGSLRVKADKMRGNVTASWAQATDLADMIVRERGLSFRTAHHIVAELVKFAGEAGRTPVEVDPAMVDEAARRIIERPLRLSEEAVKNALDPILAVRARKVIGGTAPEDVRQQVEDARAQLQADAEQITAFGKQLAQAQIRLEQAVEAMLSAPRAGNSQEEKSR
jgi:argininosuccinate lyase